MTNINIDHFDCGQIAQEMTYYEREDKIKI